MRQIGMIAEESDARRFADYLLTRGITTRVDPGPAGSEVWVHREEQVEQARAELDAFRRDPADPRYRGVEQSARALRRQAERIERQHAKNTVDLRGRWGYRQPGRIPLTIGLVASSVAVAMATWFGAQNEPLERLMFIDTFQEIPGLEGFIKPDDFAAVLGGQLWRLVTPIFLHFSPMHLLFNMLFLYDVGGLIETRRGTPRLAALVVLAAVLSNVGEYLYTGNPLFGGMSGVDYALFGYAWMKSRYEPASGLALHPNTVFMMMGWLVLCMTGFVGSIANTAHVIGLVVGVAMGAGSHLLHLARRMGR